VCTQVRLLIKSGMEGVDVVFDDYFAAIHMPDSIDSATLREHINHIVNPEQSECATKLWADDSYPRFFAMTADGLAISCVPHD
jgi:hypothetical protein